MRPTSIGLSPNLEADDFRLAFTTFLSSWKWVKGEEIKRVINWFRRYFNTEYVFTFDSGRSAEYCLLKSLGIGEGDEVLVQAFTCVAVPNSILWLGARPVFVDIEKDTFNMDSQDLKAKITKKSKAVIVQHTFGIAADLESIIKITKKHRLFLIEDCAHSLGATYQGKKVGSFGEGAFFSFGRDKIVSSVFGGAAIVKSKNIADKLRKIEKELDSPSFFWIFQQLFHPVSFGMILPLYHVFNMGKALLVILQKLSLLSKPVDKKELSSGRPPFHPRKFPNGLAMLVLKQLGKLTKFNTHRASIVSVYQQARLPFVYPSVKEGDIFLRFPLLMASAIQKKNLLSALKDKGITIGNWYSNVVDPAGVDLSKVRYLPGSCVNAEKVARLVINLPTYPTFSMGEAKKLIAILKKLTKP